MTDPQTPERPETDLRKRLLAQALALDAAGDAQTGAIRAVLRKMDAFQELTALLREAASALLAAEARGKVDGAGLITAERQRQVEAEGWTSAHDDAHDRGELAIAAACYVMAAEKIRTGVEIPSKPFLWPWDESWWKPGDDPSRTLVKAGALIAAEIDRLQRTQGEHSAPAIRAYDSSGDDGPHPTDKDNA